MKRRRPRYTIRVTLSVLLLGAAVACWVRSQRHISHVSFSTSAGHSLTVWYASHKGFEVCGDFGLRHADTTVKHHSTPLIGCVLEGKRRWYPTRPTPARHLAGFGVTPPRRDQIGNATERYPVTYVSVVAPYWFLVLCALLPALGPVVAVARGRRRRNRGLCAGCGYDLRSTPSGGGFLLDRCPECGGGAAPPTELPALQAGR